mgnify:CR=1 FL=1
MKKWSILLLTLCIAFFSCKKDKTNSRTLRYELSGTYSGTLFVSYTTASGGTANDPVTTTWNKEITYASNVTSAIIAISGNGGVPGQKVTVVVKRDGRQLSSTVATADASGSFSKPAPTVIF